MLYVFPVKINRFYVVSEGININLTKSNYNPAFNEFVGSSLFCVGNSALSSFHLPELLTIDYFIVRYALS
jgi:hypothetical protein